MFLVGWFGYVVVVVVVSLKEEEVEQEVEKERTAERCRRIDGREGKGSKDQRASSFDEKASSLSLSLSLTVVRPAESTDDMVLARGRVEKSEKRKKRENLSQRREDEKNE